MKKNILTITIGVLLLLTSNYLGHVYPPFSITLTPVLIGLFTGLVLFVTDFKLVVKFGLILGLIISNDVLIKFFAGGTHDWEGVGWISLFYILGLFSSFSLILIYGFTSENKRKKEFYFYVIISLVILFTYLSYFDSLGMIYINNPTKQIEESRVNGTFISEIHLSNDTIKTGNYKFSLKQGWIERQTRINHLGLFKRTEFTGENNCIIVLNGQFDEYEYNDSIRYEVNDSNASDSQYITKTLSFTVDKSLKEQRIFFHKADELTKHNEIKIKEINSR